ncbi:hypothetical protein ACB094_03G004400 [Castanea mollissima]
MMMVKDDLRCLIQHCKIDSEIVQIDRRGRMEWDWRRRRRLYQKIHYNATSSKLGNPCLHKVKVGAEPPSYNSIIETGDLNMSNSGEMLQKRDRRGLAQDFPHP